MASARDSDNTGPVFWPSMLRTCLLIVGLIVLAYLVVELGPGEILALLSRIGWGFVPIAGLFASHQAFRAGAFRLSAARPGAVAYTDAIAVRFSGEAIEFLTSTGPFLAEPSKALLLGRRGLTNPKGLPRPSVSFSHTVRVRGDAGHRNGYFGAGRHRTRAS